jgi:thiol-disulfide isomerase/thioredoxin
MRLLLMLGIAGCAGEPLTEESLGDGGVDPEQRERAVELPERPPAPPDLAPGLVLPEVGSALPWSLAAALDPTGSSCPRGVLIAFFAPGCPPCREGLEILHRLRLDQPDLEVVVVVEPSGEAVTEIREAGLDGPVLTADPATWRAWAGSAGAPVYLLVDRHGRITSRSVRLHPAAMSRQIQAAVR